MLIDITLYISVCLFGFFINYLIYNKSLIKKNYLPKSSLKTLNDLKAEVLENYKSDVNRMARFDAKVNFDEYSTEELVLLFKQLFETESVKKSKVEYIEKIGDYDIHKLNSLVRSHKKLKELNDELNGRLRKSEQNRSVDANSLDTKTINRMIRLCHPDKHNNSEVSNEVTSILLNMR